MEYCVNGSQFTLTFSKTRLTVYYIYLTNLCWQNDWHLAIVNDNSKNFLTILQFYSTLVKYCLNRNTNKNKGNTFFYASISFICLLGTDTL